MDNQEKIWYDALKAKGHTPAVDPYEDGDKDKLDTFFLSWGHHNGPGCSTCNWSACWHCKGPNSIPVCATVAKRQYMMNRWITCRNLDVNGYQKFTQSNKLRQINEWRELKGKAPLND